MASPYMLLHCDGAFGCNCPVERARIAERKRRQRAYADRHQEKLKKKFV